MKPGLAFPSPSCQVFLRGNLIGDKTKPEAKSKLSVLKAGERGYFKREIKKVIEGKAAERRG